MTRKEALAEVRDAMDLGAAALRVSARKITRRSLPEFAGQVATLRAAVARFEEAIAEATAEVPARETAAR